MDKDFKDTIVGQILKGAEKFLTDKERTEFNEVVEKELKKKPFRVAVIGQSGVGKSTTQMPYSD